MYPHNLHMKLNKRFEMKPSLAFSKTWFFTKYQLANWLSSVTVVGGLCLSLLSLCCLSLFATVNCSWLHFPCLLGRCIGCQLLFNCMYFFLFHRNKKSIEVYFEKKSTDNNNILYILYTLFLKVEFNNDKTKNLEAKLHFTTLKMEWIYVNRMQA